MSVLAAIAGKLFSTAISRAGSIAFQKVLRIRRIEAAHRGRSHTDKIIKTAVSDFQTAVGFIYGELTVTLDLFLRELERTGLLTVIAEEAILKRHSDTTRRAFLQLHDQIIANSADKGDRLYQAMTLSFETSLDSLMKDKAIALLLKASSGDIKNRISHVETKLDSLLSSLGGTSNADIQSTVHRSARSLLNHFKHIRIETNRGAKLIDISKIYIPSKLSLRDPKRVEQALSTVIEKERKHRTRPPYHMGIPVGTLSYAEFKSSFHRVVVLGDPGGGKSTLCQFLCYELSKLSGLQENAARGEFEVGNQKIPVRVILRSFERARLAKPQLTIFDYVLEEFRNLVAADEKELKAALQYALTYGRVVLAFDGLDEILNTSRRRDYVQLVAAFCNEYPLCPVIVTSRIVGYEDAPLPPDFEELVLEKFDNEEIKSYLVKFLSVVAGYSKADAQAKASIFLEQTEQNARDLRQNPLMLGLMAFLFAMKGDVPSNRPEIYKECALLMFEKWDQNRDIHANIPAGFDLLSLFSSIAHRVFGRPELEEGVTPGWIEEHNRQYFADFYVDKAKSIEAARSVAKFVTGRSWVMSEFGPDLYRFTHRTFLEYFFARHLEEHHETIKELFQFLLPKITGRQWDVICHLALQLKTYRSQKRIAQALELLAGAIRDSRVGGEVAAISAFGAHALEYLSGSEQDIKSLVKEIFEGCWDAAAKGDRSALEGIQICCSAPYHRSEFISAVAEESLVEAFMSARAADEVAGLISAYDARHQLRNTPTEIRKTLCNEVKKGACEFIRARSTVDPFMAQLLWEWYGESFEESYKQHGLPMILIDRREMVGEADIDIPTYLALSASHSRLFSGVRRVEKGEALAAVRAIGRHTVLPSVPIVIPKELLSEKVSAPEDMWGATLRRLSSNPLLFRGALICFIAAIEIEDQLSHSRRLLRQMQEGRTAILLRTIESGIARAQKHMPDAFEFFGDWKAGRFKLIAE